MFDILKKKLTNFIGNIVKKKEVKEEHIKPEIEEVHEKPEKIEKVQKEKSKPVITEKVEEKFEKKEEEPEPAPEKKPVKKPVVKEKEAIPKVEVKKPIVTEEVKTEPAPQKVEQVVKHKAEKEKKKIKVGFLKQVTSFITRKITISESDINDYLDMLELELLESDVAYDVSQEIIKRIKENLTGIEVPKDKLQQTIEEKIKQALVDVMTIDSPDVFEEIETKDKPVKVMFIGPNGAGKTTTIAKFAYKLRKLGYSVLLCASDTFRAAAIEQLETHANRLNVPIIKSKYGADPASVGFDAVNHAKSKGIDVVLIDTAGRQDTNYNLMEELKKIYRVVSPDYVLYVGESLVGNAIVDQINNFKGVVPITGVILTKIDCDAKGGSALSVAHGTGLPILYIGTGQEYDDLVRFDPKEIVERMI